jgi:hypothetical protein
MIGLTQVAEHPEQFKSVLASNCAMRRMPDPIFNITKGLNRDDYPIDNDAEVRNFFDFRE